MMVAVAGYSKTPLPRKLGLKAGQDVAFVNLPDSLQELSRAEAFAHVTCCETVDQISRTGLDFAQIFVDRAAVLQTALPSLRGLIKPDGMIWVCWPKKASKVATDITENDVRRMALADVLVDVKVCAVDLVWSGLKLVIRKELRAGLS